MTEKAHAYTQDQDELLSTADEMLKRARIKGADYADIYAYRATALSTEIRHGQQDGFLREEDLALGLRVFCGRASACLSTSDLRSTALDKLAEQAVAMAKHVPEDEFAQIPEGPFAPVELDIKMIDPNGEPSADELSQTAMRLEEKGLSHDGITNSEGAEASWSRSDIFLANSAGFQGNYSKTSASVSLSLIGGKGTQMERDYAYDYTTSWDGLDATDDIANLAAERTLKRLNPKQGKTGSFPVIYDRRVSSSIIRHILAAINGGRIAKGTSFLNDALNTQILPKGFTIHDNPHLDHMPKSKPFDAEAQKSSPIKLVEDGRLNHWIMDLRSAAKLGLQTNGRAARGLASQPSPSSTNVWLETASDVSLQDMIADIKDGFYVTELIGSSVSLTTGNYSRGASGFWIENGKITHAVSEVTIAGNLKGMIADMAAANDLRLRFGCDTPSLYIPKMSIASASS